MKIILKKLLTSTVLGTFLLGPVVAMPLQQAHAQLTPTPGIQVPVADTFNVPFHMFSGNKDGFFDGILFAAMKALTASLTASVVDWINTGFEGSPAFVTNEGLLLNDTHNLVFEVLAVGEIPAIYEGSGFENILVRTLAQDFVSNLRDGNTYNLDDYTEDTDAFLGGEFTKGGLGGFYQLTQNPKNNYYSAMYESQKELSARTSATTQTVNNELNRGDGFLSLRDESGNVLTPGTAIKAQLDTVLGSGIRQLELADEFNEIIGALVTQLATRALSSTGLTGASAPTSQGSSFIDQLLDDSVEQANPTDFQDQGPIDSGTPGVVENINEIHCFELTQSDGTQGTNSTRGSINLQNTVEVIDTRCSSDLETCNQDRSSFTAPNNNITVGSCRPI